MGAKLDILCMAPPYPIGILYIGGCVIIVLLLLLCVFRMILNKDYSQEYVCIMKQSPIGNV